MKSICVRAGCVCAAFALGWLSQRPAGARAKVAAPLRFELSGHKTALQVRAEQLTLSIGAPSARQLKLQGKVALTLGQLSVRCHRLEIALDGAGRVRSLEAQGGLTIKLADYAGTAQRLRLVTPSQQLELHGSPARLTAPGLAVSGRAIRVDLLRGQLRVEQAQAQIQTRER